ncbi:hypothetical protein FOXG_19280 [Fusarium oxysporum f. sp. lycopersici 4287]|uniref:DUF1275 domain protein n=1 Tax=Fusarium oxysporum f. sp. lycopersici (strain 4287 / CBS 123668 / FGSC 9935 / NRRL 34936) TaxID=426428 RepID=A0A0J9V0I4_FUSO4|nr:hypothetical protein FOXG_19280 [Fusarium oxysporum f. sp. lycopersici 4287]KAJ9419247.1 hypothetical protein QL093DRAFT_2356357 [Fusarium oxysporum]KNB04381.1 hypothetical protein FOXG_19280 [Fusarium oxysporum f. sp. lycopersici 4287]
MSFKLSINNVRRYLSANLEVDILLEIQLLLLTFSTGVQDAVSYPDFKCFASNQTGNSVVLAVGLAGHDDSIFNLSDVGLSLGMFLAGAITTGQLANTVGPRARMWLIFSHCAQTILTFAAAIIHPAYSPYGTGPSAMGSLALLAFASGAQVASMRPFRIQEITTAMATAAWVDLVIDPGLLKLQNRSRNRRAGFLIALVVGSFAGAFMRTGIGSSNALFVSGAGKTLVTLLLFLNRKQPPVDQS